MRVGLFLAAFVFAVVARLRTTPARAVDGCLPPAGFMRFGAGAGRDQARGGGLAPGRARRAAVHGRPDPRRRSQPRAGGHRQSDQAHRSEHHAEPDLRARGQAVGGRPARGRRLLLQPQAAHPRGGYAVLRRRRRGYRVPGPGRAAAGAAHRVRRQDHGAQRSGRADGGERPVADGGGRAGARCPPCRCGRATRCNGRCSIRSSCCRSPTARGRRRARSRVRSARRSSWRAAANTAPPSPRSRAFRSPIARRNSTSTGRRRCCRSGGSRTRAPTSTRRSPAIRPTAAPMR